jgi:phosphotransferase system IIB component
MFEKEDFEVPLEKQLRLRVILDEIDHCDNVQTLQENLKTCTKTLMSYQHILGKFTERQLKEEMQMFLGIMEIPDDTEDNGK